MIPAIDSNRARALYGADILDPVASDHQAATEARTVCPPKPGNPPVEKDAKGKVYLIETDEERLARAEAWIAYYSHPDCPERGVPVGTIGDSAELGLAAWQRFLGDVRERLAGRAA